MLNLERFCKSSHKWWLYDLDYIAIDCYNKVTAIWLATAYSCIWAELGSLWSITMNLQRR